MLLQFNDNNLEIINSDNENLFFCFTCGSKATNLGGVLLRGIYRHIGTTSRAIHLLSSAENKVVLPDTLCWENNHYATFKTAFSLFSSKCRVKSYFWTIFQFEGLVRTKSLEWTVLHTPSHLDIKTVQAWYDSSFSLMTWVWIPSTEDL